MKFVLFHGAFGGPEGNWFPELKEKLESFGQEIIAPQFPVDDWDEVTKKGYSVPPQNQNLKNWLSTFEQLVLPQLKKGDELCFIGHSLGPLFILHVVEKFNLKLDSAIFVSPFLRKLNESWQIDHVNSSFYKVDFDFEKLKKYISQSWVFYTDNDPYVKKEYALEFADKLNTNRIFIKRAGHFNEESGYTKFNELTQHIKDKILTHF